jgi:hypothetical protein
MGGFSLHLLGRILWWIPFTKLNSESLFYDPINFFEFVAYLIISGIIFGIMGMAITQFMVIFVFKQPEQI